MHAKRELRIISTCELKIPYEYKCLSEVAVVETGVATRSVGHVPRAISSVCRLLSDL